MRTALQEFNVSISRAVDHIELIVAGMRDVEMVEWRVNVGMVEAACAAMFRQVNMTDIRHG
jgi:hypothetical protein